MSDGSSRRGTDRTPPPVRVAALDLGTNTFRSLIAEIGGEVGTTELKPLQVLRRVTRLGQELHRRKTFHPDAVRRSLKALDEFQAGIQRYRVHWAGGICTEAFRSAHNGPALLRKIRSRYGWEMEIVSARREAEAAMRGIQHSLPLGDKRTLAIDIGGGSTEFLHIRSNLLGFKTTRLGVVRLTEAHLRHDPPTAAEMETLTRAIDMELKEVRKALFGLAVRLPHFDRFVGTAGTVTTLGAMSKKLSVYDPRVVTGTRLSASFLSKLLARLERIPARERLRHPGLEKGREDLILAGIVLLLRTMDCFSLPVLTVCDSGILEGIALGRMGKA